MSFLSFTPVKPGDVLAGKYRVEKILGTGAMGVVVAATHLDLHEIRAIKFMLPSALSDGEAVERFLREARAAVRLKSQHVAKIFDIGRLETGSPYIVMEYLEGCDLKQLLGTNTALPVHEAVGYMLQVCEAIAEAHGFGIVHRDLKPANLFKTSSASGAPCIKVLDFGIAKLLGDQDGLDMTQTTALLGTPLYMSPEQMRASRSVDGRSDIWALGALLYRMLTGRTPFLGGSVTEICAAVVADQPDPVAVSRGDVPPPLEAAIMRCLEKNPAKRFATAAELAAAIAPFATAAPTPGAIRGGSWNNNNPLGGTAILDTTANPLMASPRASMPSHPQTAPMPVFTGAPLPHPSAPGVSATVVGAVPAAAAVTAPGHATGEAAWMQPAPVVVAPPKKSSAGLVVAALVGLTVLAGGGFVAMRFSSARAQATPLAPVREAPAAATASVPTAAPIVTAATAAPSASASASAAASAEPAVDGRMGDAPASAAPQPSAAPPARGARHPAPRSNAWSPPPAAPPPAPPPPPRPAQKDAFGDDRK